MKIDLLTLRPFKSQANESLEDKLFCRMITNAWHQNHISTHANVHMSSCVRQKA